LTIADEKKIINSAATGIVERLNALSPLFFYIFPGLTYDPASMH